MIASSSMLIGLMASSVLAAPGLLTPRADTDKDTQIHFQCSTQIIPDPVAGGWGGSGYALLSVEKDGQTGGGKDCTVDPDNGNCKWCNFPTEFGFGTQIDVHACYTNIAGDCHMTFNYGGHEYDSRSDPQCTTDKGFEPFGAVIDARCYFNAH